MKIAEKFNIRINQQTDGKCTHDLHIGSGGVSMPNYILSAAMQTFLSSDLEAACKPTYHNPC